MSQDLITFRCPQCQAALSLPANLAGAKGPCLYCKTEIIGPNPQLGEAARLASSDVSVPVPVPSPQAQPHHQHQQQQQQPVPQSAPHTAVTPDPESIQRSPEQQGFPTEQSFPAAAASTAPLATETPVLSPLPSPYPERAGLPEPGLPSPRQTVSREVPGISPQFPQPDSQSSLPPTRQMGVPPRDAAPAQPLPTHPFPEFTGEPATQTSPFPTDPTDPALSGSIPADDFSTFETEGFKTGWSQRAPLIVGGVLVLILAIFGVYLWNDFNKMVPEESGTAPSGVTPQSPPENAAATTNPPQPLSTPANTPPAPSGITANLKEPGLPGPAPETAPEPTPAETASSPAAPPVSTLLGDSPPTIETTETAGTPPLAIEPVVPLTIDEPGADRNTDTTGLLDPPIKALQQFLNAPTWQTRLDNTLHPELMRPLMESYYRAHPDGVVVPTAMRFQHSESDPDTKLRFYVFHLTTENSPDGFPVLIEETTDGLKIDWETFVEFKDNLFNDFASNPITGKTGTFHLIMRNAHYFGPEFAELGDLTAYRLDPPIPDQESYAFARTDSIVNKTLQKQVTWGMNFTPYLELRWAKSESGADYLQIVRLLHNNWRNREP